VAVKKSVKKFAGVYFSESTIRKWRERPDRCYWVNFKDCETGKLRWERCGWASEGWTPEAAQRRRYELLEQDRAGEYKPRQERKADQLTFGRLMDDHYLPWSDANKKRCRDDRCLYKNWLEARFALKSLRDISPLDLERLKKDMRDAEKAEATVKHALCLARQAFNKAVAWGLWTGNNPCRAVKFPSPNNARQRFLSHKEADSLIKALQERSPQIGRAARLSLYSGMRMSELFALRWSDVDLRNGVITVLDSKNNQSRPVFITDRIREILDELPPGKPDELLFKTKQGKPVIWMSKTFKGVVDDLGLNKGITDPRQKLSFHSLRHTFASWAVIEGTPLYVVGKALGHKTAVMTQRYAHLSPESQRAAFEAVARSQDRKTRKRGAQNVRQA